MTVPEICSHCRRGLKGWMETSDGVLCFECCEKRYEITQDARLLTAVLLLRQQRENRMIKSA